MLKESAQQRGHPLLVSYGKGVPGCRPLQTCLVGVLQHVPDLKHKHCHRVLAAIHSSILTKLTKYTQSIMSKVPPQAPPNQGPE